MDEMKKKHLVPHTEKDTALKDYVSKHLQESVLDIKLIWTEAKPRVANQWEAIAIKFKPGMNRDQLLQKVVSIKADEYWGKLNGYYIFWWD